MININIYEQSYISDTDFHKLDQFNIESFFEKQKFNYFQSYSLAYHLEKEGLALVITKSLLYNAYNEINIHKYILRV